MWSDRGRPDDRSAPTDDHARTELPRDATLIAQPEVSSVAAAPANAGTYPVSGGCDSFASTATRETSQSLSRSAPANGSGANCRDRREDCGRLHWRQRVETHSCSRQPDAIAQPGRKTVVDEHSRSFTGTRYIGQLGRQLVQAEHPRMSLEKKAKDGTLSEVVVGHRSSLYEHLFV